MWSQINHTMHMVTIETFELEQTLALLAGDILPLAALPLLASCDMVAFNAAGDVARQQGDLILISTGLMLLIIVPVMAATASG